MSTALQLLGTVSPGLGSLADPKTADLPYTKTLLPGGVLGAAGALYGLQIGHPFLGFIVAETVGQNAFRWYHNQPGDRRIAYCNLAQSAAIVAGALAWKDRPFYGGVLGLAAGLLATSLVAGSNSNRLMRGLSSHWPTLVK